MCLSTNECKGRLKVIHMINGRFKSKRAEKLAKEAFMEDIRAIERKHGFRLTYFQPHVQALILPLVPEVSKEARQAVETALKPTAPAIPWYKRIFKSHDRTTPKVQDTPRASR